MKNKQIVIELHEGCINPNDPIIRGDGVLRDQTVVVKQWLLERLQNDPDCILIDKIEVIDCDCETES